MSALVRQKRKELLGQVSFWCGSWADKLLPPRPRSRYSRLTPRTNTDRPSILTRSANSGLSSHASMGLERSWAPSALLLCNLQGTVCERAGIAS
jgi:hypothetical protein